MGTAHRTIEKLRKVDTETDPEALFNELLMQGRPDDWVTPHLINRLRLLEENQQLQRSEEQQPYTEYQALLLEREGDD
ncbi:hypothetical protein [Synechococcus sp. BA-132 BA5]|uniref:hypothetical protein n=1 Tax=Synechococcus sp. BA-132 BA5 TaxID=3110252 RepID=UPI002B1F5377|nr:hypothetical protein [Synechococcus sp. BA-132 BA5]MEA5414377.1 hypothetical protein [Synechococcus sp. BA-132 BA5]